MRARPRFLRRRHPAAPAEPAPFDGEAAAPHVRLLSSAPAARGESEPEIDVDVDDEPGVEDDAGAVVLELRTLAPDLLLVSEGAVGPMDPTGSSETAVAQLPARNLERIVYELAVRNEMVGQRVERIERRLDELADAVFDAATQCDLIEVEARRARLAAEVTRLSVQLRAEIDGGLQRLAREMTSIVAARGEVSRLAPCPVALSQLADLDTMVDDLVEPAGPFAATAG